MKELYMIRTPYTFLGVQGDPVKTRLSIVGIPFDSTNSFRGGSRFAPIHIRVASQSLETYSFRAGVSLDMNPPYDEGDIAVVHGNAELTLRNIASVSEELFRAGRTPLFMGGDHTITYGVIEGALRAGIKPCLLVFDAHLDFRKEYLGYKWSHACVIRRVSEIISTSDITVVGVRAVDKDELREAKIQGLTYLPITEINKMTSRDVSSRISNKLASCEKIYISVDMDSIDPSYAPGVATPEPEGLTPTFILNLLHTLIDKRIIGFDIVEVDPTVDPSDITSFLAARIMIEVAIYASIAKKLI